MPNNQYPTYCCQRCGEEIGYLGRFLEIIWTPFLWIAKSMFHSCPALFAFSPKEITKSQGYNRRNDTPILNGVNSAPNEYCEYSRTGKQEHHNPSDAGGRALCRPKESAKNS